MKSAVKLALTILVSAYLGAGLFVALLLQRAVPPLNLTGMTFIAVTWPNQIRCARVESDCKALPEWGAKYFFTFSDAQP